MSKEMNRRRFLKVLGATSGGTAALAGCSTDEVERLIPYLVPPDNEIPGIATWYSSTCRECASGCGLHVKVREGRAIKVEGNPNHPVNQGALCARGQASLQGLYNPDRVRGPMARAGDGTFEPISWDEAKNRIVERLGAVSGDRVWFLTGNEAGSFDTLISEWMRALDANPRVIFEPFAYEALLQANQRVFGIDALPSLDFSAARFILSFGTDFLETWLNPVEQTRGFSASHSFGEDGMGRYVHIEPRMSMTAMSADEWIAPKPGTEAAIALGIAAVIVRDALVDVPRDASRVQDLLDAHDPAAVSAQTGVSADIIERLAREFTQQPSLAVAGGIGAQHDQAHETAAAVNILNYMAGNVGRTVKFGADLNPAGDSSYRDVMDLVNAMQGGSVGVLFVHGANPAYATPSGAGFVEAMRNVSFKVSFSRFLDETTMEVDLILPDHDALEQWNDFEPRANVYSLQQPVMQPVFDTRQTGDVLLELASEMGDPIARRFTATTYKEYLQNRWRSLQRRLGDSSPFDAFWSASLQQGGMWSATPTTQVRLAATAGSVSGSTWSGAGSSELTLIAFPSSSLFDGRGANRPWLQELPDPVTKVTWTTWVELNPNTAAEYDLHEGEVVEVTSSAGSITAPAYLHPGLREGVVAIPLGQGHTAFGRYAQGKGAKVNDLLSSQPTAFGGLSHYTSVTIRKTGEFEPLPTTEGSRRQLGRGMAQATTLAALEHPEEHPEEEHAEHAAPVPEHIEEVLDEFEQAQYDEWRNRGSYAGEHPRWGMAIDLSKCTGCNACVTACYAENNIPTVGPERVRHGREMSWLRIERYFEGEDANVEARFLPMLCQHCSNAPCEPVCPVFATYHTPDGLNAQVYNRCVGTRYCSNNCPYKVRYFNWFDYQNEADEVFAWPDPLHWLLNPDVTVRVKGVMEKCTFCVQRIRGKQHGAKTSGEPLQDGDVLTACQQTCPADAIVFGDLNDSNSRVRQLSQDGRRYQVLGGLNTRPAITYLKKVRNLTEA